MKQDRKLLSKQKHEIAYVRKLARDYSRHLKRCEWFTFKGDKNIIIQGEPDALKILCKAVLKFAK